MRTSIKLDLTRRVVTSGKAAPTWLRALGPEAKTVRGFRPKSGDDSDSEYENSAEVRELPR